MRSEQPIEGFPEVRSPTKPRPGLAFIDLLTNGFYVALERATLLGVLWFLVERDGPGLADWRRYLLILGAMLLFAQPLTRTVVFATSRVERLGRRSPALVTAGITAVIVLGALAALATIVVAMSVARTLSSLVA